MKLKAEQLLDMMEKMITIRQFEIRIKKSFAEGDMPGFVHLYAGEEAIAVGCCANLNKDDYITSHHRGHGHVIAKGGDINLMMAELYGKKNGYCKGKGGSMHIADMDLGILGANGIVGAGIPIAAGSALSAKLRGTKQVTLCFFGDGASNTARFHEGINLAAIWNLPVVYIIENNHYAEATHISRTAKVKNLSDRAIAYGIPGETIESNDVLEIFKKVGLAIERARNGGGPSLIEIKTYRIFGHEEGDLETYKNKEDIEHWAKKDPIELFKNQLIEKDIFSEEGFKQMQIDVINKIEKAIKFAKESPFPELEETLTDVYV